MWTESEKFAKEHAGKRCTSHTELMCAAECPMKHYKQYVEGNKTKSHHMFYGTALDDVFTHRVKCIKDKKPVPSLLEAQDEFLGKYTQACEKSPDVDETEEQVKDLEEKGPKHVEIFIKEVEPKLKPLDAQFRFYMPIVEFNPNDPLYLRGDLDYVDQRKFFIDWKTVGNTPSLNWAHRKAEAKRLGVPEDDAFKEEWKAKNPDDTIIPAKYLAQLKTYFFGLHFAGYENWNGAYLFNFIKKLKTPKLMKQRVEFQYSELFYADWLSEVQHLAMIVEGNYQSNNGIAPLRLGRFFDSPYSVTACDMCDQRDFEGIWGRC
jgi:hypothetical protein